MMAQYLEIKGQYPDALLFYRMGDFYELFFDDAVTASRVLDIALTKRGKINDVDIPMCGVPHHSSESYLLTLIKSGHKVAVCEQLESPAEAKKRGSKSVVKRDVVRLVTPGTLTEDSLLEARSNNFLAAYSLVREEHSLAWVDISTGLMSVLSLNKVEDFLKNTEYLDIPDLMMKLKNNGDEILCHYDDCMWLDIGRIDDYSIATKIFAENKEKFLPKT